MGGNIVIDSSDISVIVQGPIYKTFTPKCIQSIRKILPDCEIILSTWKGSIVPDLDFDILVLSDDPGTTIFDRTTNAQNNINRQLVSTQAGLAKASRKYAMKVRSDIEFFDNHFLQFFGLYDRLCPAEYFHNRLLVCNYFCRNARVAPLPYHITDWFMFGYLDDVKDYYQVRLQTYNEDHWFATHKKETRLFKHFECRYTPEQYICINFLRKKRKVVCDCYYHCTDREITETEQFIANNLVILDYGKQLNIFFPKYNPNRYFEKYTLLSYEKWKIIFFKYCLSKFQFSFCTYILQSIVFKCAFIMRLLIIQVFMKTNTKEKVKNFLTKFRR